MKRITLTLTALLLVAAVGASIAGDDSHEAELNGYCPVAYIAMGEAIKGDPSISVEYGGHHYQLANAEAKKMFEADPSKYHVAYNGYCATAVSMGKKLDSDPTIFIVDDGVTYLFSSADAKKMFEANAEGTIAKADGQWSLINPAFGGHCPVAYVEMKQAITGDPEISLDYQGTHYVFANADAKKMFEKDPAKYHVAYSGYCATAMSMGKWFESDPNIFTIEGGVVYLFSSAEAKKMFDAAPAGFIEKADEQFVAMN